MLKNEEKSFFQRVSSYFLKNFKINLNKDTFDEEIKMNFVELIKFKG